MEITKAAEVLSSSILIMLSFIVVVIGIVVINNILHKHWKPVKIFTDESFSPFKHSDQDHVRFATEDELKKLAPLFTDPNLDIKGKKK